MGSSSTSSPSGYLNATDANTPDGAQCSVDLDGASLSTTSDPTGFFINGLAADQAVITLGDNFMFVGLFGLTIPGATVSYVGGGAFNSIVNPFSLIIGP